MLRAVRLTTRKTNPNMKNFSLNFLLVLASFFIIFLIGLFFAQANLEIPLREWIGPRLIGIGILAQCFGVPLGMVMLAGVIQSPECFKSREPGKLYVGLATSLAFLTFFLLYLVVLSVVGFSVDSRLYAAHLMVASSLVVGTIFVWMIILGWVGIGIAKRQRRRSMRWLGDDEAVPNTEQKQGCQLCHQAAYGGMYEPLKKLATAPDGWAFLFQCEVCSTYWLQNVREAHIIQKAEAQRDFPQVFEDVCTSTRNCQVDFQFIFRNYLTLEVIKTALYQSFNINETQLIAYSQISLDDGEDVLYYEYFTTNQGFRTYLDLHLFGDDWLHFCYKNVILDLGVMLATALQEELIVAPEDPITPYLSDWVLIKPNGTLYRVQEKHPEDDYFFIKEEPVQRLSDEEIASMKQRVN